MFCPLLLREHRLATVGTRKLLGSILLLKNSLFDTPQVRDLTPVNVDISAIYRPPLLLRCDGKRYFFACNEVCSIPPRWRVVQTFANCHASGAPRMMKDTWVCERAG